MSDTLNRIKKRLEEFKNSPVGYGARLRLDFAEIIWCGLERNNWSQRRLSREVGLADSVVSNLIHGNKNCTLDTVGKIIHALGTRATLQEMVPSVELSDATLWVHGVTAEAVPFSIKVNTSVQTSTFKIKANDAGV